jgi:hypothetical protein
MVASISDSKCVVYKPPRRAEGDACSVFLAGSIEMGVAEDWQSELTTFLADLPVAIFNPRRDDYDAGWPQDISFAPFREQVEWELDHLERADVIVLFFQARTMSPISLLELGMHAKSGKLLVCCPEGYWRRGNVQVVCRRSGVPLVDTKEELKQLTKEKVKQVLEKVVNKV